MFTSSGQILKLFFIALAASLSPLHMLAKAEEVRPLQQFLTERECNPGPIDGQWGGKTEAALALFQVNANTNIVRPIEPADLELLGTSSFKCSDIQNISYFVPADVFKNLDSVPNETRSKLCLASTNSRQAVDSVVPREKIEGLNSKMSNAEEVYGFAELQMFASAFSDVATQAYVHDDDDAKKQLIEALARWAGLGAYQQTRDCVNGRCPAEWRDPNGLDISPEKDHSTSVDFVMAIAMAYYTVLSDFKTEEFSRQHTQIKSWLESFGRKLRNPSGSRTYFGLRMGHQWNHLLMEMSRGDMASFRQRLTKLSETIGSVVLEDGALKDRTTRGDRAIWYHHASLGELIGSLEMMRANQIPIDPDLEAKTHRAVTIFLDAADDPASIMRWASESHNNGSDGSNQDFLLNDFRTTDWGSSWAYAYVHRHPNHPNSVRLRAVLDNLEILHTRDMGLGVNFGCFYRAADEVFQSIEVTGKSAFEQSIVTYATSFENVSVSIWNAGNADDTYEDYKINIRTAKFGDVEKNRMSFGVLADYPNPTKDTNSIILMRMYVDTRNFRNVDGSAPDFSECGDMAYSSQYSNVRLHFGGERALNQCIFSKLDPVDLKLWYSIYNDFDAVIGEAESIGGEAVEKLAAIYERKID